MDDTFPYGPYFKHPVSEPTSASLAGIDTTTTTTTTTDISNAANNVIATTTGTAPVTDTISHTEAEVTQLGQVQQSSVDVGASSAQNVYTSRETGTPHSTATTTNSTTNTNTNTNTNTSTPLANIFGDAANDTSTNAAATGASANTGGFGDSEVMDWFMNNRNIGLDFVAPWTEMIEQQLNLNDQFNF